MNVIKVDAMPSWGMMANFSSLGTYDQQAEGLDYLQSIFNQRGANRYFGSTADRYRDTFDRTIRTQIDRTRRADLAIRDALSVFTEDDAIRPCISEASLRRLPPSMYKAILSHRPLYNLFRQGRVQGWAEYTPEDIKPEVRRWTRLLDRNGAMLIDPEHDNPEKEDKLCWTWTTEDPDLSLQQIIDIKRTRRFVDYVLENSQLDPTDLDMVRS